VFTMVLTGSAQRMVRRRSFIFSVLVFCLTGGVYFMVLSVLGKL
jgi:hypothetical protein